MPTSGNNLAGHLLTAAQEAGHGPRVALRQGDETWTYDALREQVTRAAGALTALGIGRGERVAILMPDSLDAAAALLGIIYAGAVAVPLGELTRATEIRAYLDHCGAKAAIVHAAQVAALDAVRGELAQLDAILCVGGEAAPGMHDYREQLAATQPREQAEAVESSDAAMLVYSIADVESDLRGVPHTHGTPRSAFASFAQGVLGIGPDDRVLCMAQLSTVYGLGLGLFFPLAAGAQNLFVAEQPSTEDIVAAVRDFEPTVVMAAPSLYRQLVRDAESDSDGEPAPLLSACRACIAGSEGMPPRLMERVREVLGAPIMVGFGLSEAFQFVLMGTPEDALQGACGRPVAGFEARLVDENGEPVGPSVIGTLQIRGPTLLSSYWTPEHEEEAMGRRAPTDRDRAEPDWVWHRRTWPEAAWPAQHWGDGWFTTRDRFLRDEGGNFYHFGRIDDLFKVGGKWISPAEMERALGAHEAVWECAVVGTEDEDGLTKPMAFVVPNVGHTAGPELARTLRDYLKSELASYKYPRWLEFVEHLPRGPQGKILRFKLLARSKMPRKQ
ncbi:AMP-binding protein [Haliangium ochraceum]|uniref:AMP-dependent synthetase and ligase n=1 Tax=Haliangium ochraceum (strain DSM 14365 / JCM 11303 / SMP-2) TaxID=502025 RepID=D0LU96_HALO1|nr:AMP-binding protein [Haliangium ochraceum]ACY17460.1 AMP-dependent synthetase and ligase [Haliangium ochraceum DSM 14365]